MSAMRRDGAEVYARRGGGSKIVQTHWSFAGVRRG